MSWQRITWIEKLLSRVFNDPEWASKEEWHAYAWFGFALSEAQAVEMLLQVLATALHMDSLLM